MSESLLPPPPPSRSGRIRSTSSSTTENDKPFPPCCIADFKVLFSIMMDWQSVILPLALLLITFGIGCIGPVWTLFSLGFMPISLNLIKKYFKIKDSSTFYFSFTLYSILITHTVFELITCSARFASITKFEYILNICLFCVSCYCIHQTKNICDLLAHASAAGTPTLQGNTNQSNYNYCKKCKKLIHGRDHHCVWLNTCIGKSNRYWFLATVFFSSVWLFTTIMINLTSLCYPVYLLSGLGFEDGSGTSGRWFLVPFSCPDVYEKDQALATISFVTSIYGLGVSILLMLIFIHQLRLLYKGVSYLESRFGPRSQQPSRRVH